MTGRGSNFREEELILTHGFGGISVQFGKEGMAEFIEQGPGAEIPHRASWSEAKSFFSALNCAYIHEALCGHVHACTCPSRPEHGIPLDLVNVDVET